MIELTNDQVKVFGRPNFACANIAKVLIAAGVYKADAQKSEYEQAVFIHWASGLLAEHGPDWSKVAEKTISALVAELAKNEVSMIPVI